MRGGDGGCRKVCGGGRGSGEVGCRDGRRPLAQMLHQPVGNVVVYRRGEEDLGDFAHALLVALLVLRLRVHVGYN